jgi:glycosyltransferase involved in cell wall biosynthesis
LKRELIRLGIRRKRIDVIPNWVNTERFKPIKTNKIYDLIFAGSLYAEKQLPLLFDAHKYLSSQTKGLGCTPSIMILGDGPMRSAWEQHEYVKKLNINFVGWQQNISTWYNKSRIFVLPSKIEGMPSALLEAMACALPPVATAVGGIPEVIQNHKNGLLVPPANHKLLAENIVELLENDRLRVELGTHARSTVLRKFDIDKIIPRYIDVFNKL